MSVVDLSYSNIDGKNVLNLISTSRMGLAHSVFIKIVAHAPFTTREWAHYLHISERTMQRHMKEKRMLAPAQSEKVIEITLLYKYGVAVFGDKQNFDSWLDTVSIALGGIKPKSLLDTTFGIGLLKDELGRIEYGVLA